MSTPDPTIPTDAVAVKAAFSRIVQLIHPANFTEALEIAAKLSDSDLVPAAYKRKPANIVIAWELGAEIGLSPMTALQSIAVINGKPCLYGEAPLAVVMASGLLEWISEEDDGEVATCAVKRKGWPKEIKRTFSMAEAAAAKMYEREEGGAGKWVPLIQRWAWQNWPKDMRKYRARGRALKDSFADVLKGLEIAEKVADEGILDGTGTVIEAEQTPEDFTPRRLSETIAAPRAPCCGCICERCIVGHEKGQAPHTQACLDAVQTQRDAGSLATPVDSSAPEPPPLIPAALPSSASVPAPLPAPEPAIVPAGQTFTLNGVTHTTKGLTRDQFLEAATYVPKADKRIARGYSKSVLAKILGVQVSDPKCHRNELTAEQGQRWISALKAAVGGDQAQTQGTL